MEPEMLLDLSLSNIETQFDPSAADNLLKHGDKNRDICSCWVISPFAKMLLNLFANCYFITIEFSYFRVNIFKDVYYIFVVGKGLDNVKPYFTFLASCSVFVNFYTRQTCWINPAWTRAWQSRSNIQTLFNPVRHHVSLSNIAWTIMLFS